MPKKFTQEEVEARFTKRGWKLVDKYINQTIKVKAVCPYCNNIKLVYPDNVFLGKTQSCGCIANILSSKKRSTSTKEKSVGFLYPKIAGLYSKNNEKSVFEIYPNSSHKFLWICEKYGHEYKARSYNIILGNRCSYCAGKKVLLGFNDLAFQRPDLLLDWDYSKNKIKPEEITCYSNKRIWWKCYKCDYKWVTLISCRSGGTGCPKCHPISYGAEKIKQILTDWKIDFEIEKRFETCKNKRCLPFDFYLPNNNILIEYQGEQHYKEDRRFKPKENLEKRQLHDQIKKDWSILNNYNLLIISYWDQNKIEDILTKEVKNGNTSN